MFNRMNLNTNINVIINPKEVSTPLKEKRLLAEERGKRLRMLRVLSGLSRQQFQTQLNVSISTLNIWENGKICLTKKGALRVINAVKEVGIICSEDWLMFGNGLAPYNSNNKSYNNLYTSDSSLPTEVEFFLKNNPNAIFTKIDDEFMLPIYHIGDIVAGIPSEDINNAIGFVSIIRTNDFSIVRRIEKIEKDNLYLAAFNKNTANDNFVSISINNIKSIAKILLHRSF